MNNTVYISCTMSGFNEVGPSPSEGRIEQPNKESSVLRLIERIRRTLNDRLFDKPVSEGMRAIDAELKSLRLQLEYHMAPDETTLLPGEEDRPTNLDIENEDTVTELREKIAELEDVRAIVQKRHETQSATDTDSPRQIRAWLPAQVNHWLDAIGDQFDPRALRIKARLQLQQALYELQIAEIEELHRAYHHAQSAMSPIPPEERLTFFDPVSPADQASATDILDEILRIKAQMELLEQELDAVRAQRREKADSFYSVEQK